MLTILAALLAGLLLFAADHPLHWWPLHLCAFVPLLWALRTQRRQGRRLWYLGALFGLGYVVPLAVSAGLVAPILAIGGAVVLQWTLLAMVVGRLLTRGPLLGALAAAAAVTLGEWAIWHLVPMFGTGQCFARVLAAAPALVAFTAFTGMAGVVFALVLTQGLLVGLLQGPERRAPALLLLGTLLVLGGASTWRWQRDLGPTLRVATIGWVASAEWTLLGSDSTAPETTAQAIDGAMASAVGQGARLVVTPETGIYVGDRKDMLARLGELARRHGVHAAFGIWHAPGNDNRIWLFGPDGGLVGEYAKTHLIPWLEDYRAGDGTLLAATIEGARWGGMICQDDNFTDLARGYGRQGAVLVTVPTNDWDEIRHYHLDSGVCRAIENGYAVVRAASHGISAVISPRGEVLARLDHVAAPRSGLLVADVPLGDGVPTVQARWGDWPVVFGCAVLLLLALVRRTPRAAG